MRLDRSKAFGLWSKYFAGISDSGGSGINKSEGSSENKGESNRAIIAIIFQLLFYCFSSCNITRSLLVILV
jgi:hypothetical protein